MRRAQVAFLLLLVPTIITNQWRYALNAPTIDFFINWSVPHALSKHLSHNVYSAAGRSELTSVMEEESKRPYTSRNQQVATLAAVQLGDGTIDAPGTPFLYAAIGTLSSGDYATDQQRFAAVCLLSFVIAVILLCRLLSFSWEATILGVLALASSYAPMASDVAVGNLNQIQLLIIALFIVFLAREHPFAAGVVIGLGIMLKPNVGVIAALAVVVALIDRRWRELSSLCIGVLLAGGFAAGLSSWYCGTAVSWENFARSLPSLLTRVHPLQNGNVGLSVLVASVTNLHVAIPILLLIVGMFATVMFSSRAHARTIRASVGRGALCVSEAFSIASMGCGVMLLASDLAWLHYYVLLIPLVLYALRPSPNLKVDVTRRSHRVSQVTVVVAVFALSSTSAMLTHDLLRFAIVINSAAVVLVGFVLLDLWHQRSRSGPLSNVTGMALAVAPGADGLRASSTRRRRKR